MFWGCIAYNGVGTIIHINGNMNSVKYIEPLDNNLWQRLLTVLEERLSTDVLLNLFVRSSNVCFLFSLTIRKSLRSPRMSVFLCLPGLGRFSPFPLYETRTFMFGVDAMNVYTLNAQE
jgi:hypothetical protein